MREYLVIAPYPAKISLLFLTMSCPFVIFIWPLNPVSCAGLLSFPFHPQSVPVFLNVCGAQESIPRN